MEQAIPAGDTPEVETARIVFRRPLLTDIGPLSRILADAPEQGLTASVPTAGKVSLDGRSVPPELTADYWQANGYGFWVLVYRETRTVIGCCGFRQRDGRLEFCCVIAPAWRLAGLATEAAGACLRYGFEKMALGEITAHVSLSNVPFVRLLRKLGMTLTGQTGNARTQSGLSYSLKSGEYADLHPHFAPRARVKRKPPGQQVTLSILSRGYQTGSGQNPFYRGRPDPAS
ncbi:MAG: GNAT family N-acetyltransferase [Blastocatellia bacterium]